MAAYQPNLKRFSVNDDAGNSPKKQKAEAGGSDAATPLATVALDEKKRKLEEARARAAAIVANLGNSSARSTPSQRTASPASATLPSASSLRLAEMKARVAALTKSSSAAVATSPSTNVIEMQNEGYKSRGGLDVGLHPALLSDSMEGGSLGRRQPIQPRFATTMANQRNDASAPGQNKAKTRKLPEAQRPSADENASNPYFDPKLGGGAATYQKNRAAKSLIFNQKGKYIEQANALRRQAQLEKMKKRIADAARRAGIEEEMDTDKAFLKDAPPDVEWWDQGLCATQSYDDLETANLKIDTPDSIITIYIQHPILIEPPMEKHIPAPKPLPLTHKEQKKIRLQARMEKLKEQQAKIRLGLEPAPPPKIKKSNLMKVLGEEAVKNPTAVEARVNKEIAARHDKHLQENQDRKLTKEEKLEKLAINQDRDLAKGVHCLVFRIENLSNGAHRFKIQKNIEQYALHGKCILNPKFNLLIVEGGEWAIKKYRHLILNRIKWDETSAPNSSMHQDNPDGENAVKAEDLAQHSAVNTCTLIWEGELKTKAFRKFTTSKCASEGEVRKILERNKMENYWTLAKGKVSVA